MRLSIEQIKSITKGAVNVSEEEEGIVFYRFTKEQENVYERTNQESYLKTFSTAGIRLEFETNSENLYIKTLIKMKSGNRSFFSFDISVNGEIVGYLDNFSDVTIPENYVKTKFKIGEFSKRFLLGKDIKRVCIYFPWSVQAIIKEIIIDDGAYIKPVEKRGKLLIYGDSITQGYDALRSSMRYAAKLADELELEEINKAIAGELFLPELAKYKDDFEPDYILVAYGTNDFSVGTADSFQKKCKGFFEKLTEHYPNTRIFALTPIWRKDHAIERKFGMFGDVVTYIINAVKKLENVTVICGYSFVPDNEKYFSDKLIHPTDEGFKHYYDNLRSILLQYIGN